MKKAIGYLIIIGLVALVALLYISMFGLVATFRIAMLILIFVGLTITAINLIS